MMDLSSFQGYFEEVLQTYIVEKLFYLEMTFPSSLHPALTVPLEERETVQNYCHLYVSQTWHRHVEMED